MKLLSFEDLARLPILATYETAFRKATGVSLKLVPPDNMPLRQSGPCENGFCHLVGGTPAGSAACLETERRAQRNVARQLRIQQLSCYAGLTVLACPVMINNQHVASFLSGQVLRREPTERDFLMLMKMLGRGLDTEWVAEARRAYFATPVLNAERLQAVIQLLQVFAQYLAEVASRQAIACSEVEPAPVTNAKKFVQVHVEEPITLDQVVDHVHVSRFYFCKLFKKATGMTMTEYVARLRVEKAKGLLSDPNCRVSEVVFAAGFGSIPQFNTIFKRHVGMPPSEYRAALRSEPRK